MVDMSVEKDVHEIVFDNQNNGNSGNKIFKYPRSTLYSLKNSKSSLRKPQCFYRDDLHGLSCWKSATVKIDKNRIQPKMKYIPPTLKSMEDNSRLGLENNNLRKNFEHSFDPRSISSAHLLPAFAKRRLLSSSENIDATHPVNDMTDSDSKVRYEQELRNPHYSKNGKDVHEDFGEDEEDVVSEFNPENTCSPISSSLKAGNISNDKRIGSGRFLPRDNGWDNPSEGKKYLDSFPKGRNSPTTKLPNLKHSDSDFKRCDLKDKRFSGTASNNETFGNLKRDNRRYSTKLKDNIGNHRSTNDRSRRYQSRIDANEEPEWFSEGPTSKLDTIELRGFDENVDNSDDFLENDEEKDINSVESPNFKPNVESQNNFQCSGGNSARLTPSQTMDIESNSENVKPNFNIDTFLSLEPLMNIESKYTGDSSRFSQWFKSNTVELVANNNANNNKVISLNVDDKVNESMNENNALLQFLRAGNITKSASINQPLNVQSIPSVEELEARMQKINIRVDKEKQNIKPAANVDVFNNFLNKLNENSAMHIGNSYIKLDNPSKNEGLQQQRFPDPGNTEPYHADTDLNQEHNLEMSNGHPRDKLIKQNDYRLCSDQYTNNVDEKRHYNNQPNSFGSSAPSPLAFTPTSVLRKMTAEKESITQSASVNIHQNDKLSKSQFNFQEQPFINQNFAPRMILGGNSANMIPVSSRPQNMLSNSIGLPSQTMGHHHMQEKNKLIFHMTPPPNPIAPKPIGRPILKGNVHMPHLQHIPQTYFDSKVTDHIIYQNELFKRNQTNPQVVLNQLGHPVRPFDQPHHISSYSNNLDRHFQLQNPGSVSKNKLTNEFLEMGLNNGGGNFIMEQNVNSGSETKPQFQECDQTTRSNQLSQWFSHPMLSQPSLYRQPCEVNTSLTLEEFENKLQNYPTVVNN